MSFPTGILSDEIDAIDHKTIIFVRNYYYLTKQNVCPRTRLATRKWPIEF